MNNKELIKENEYLKEKIDHLRTLLEKKQQRIEDLEDKNDKLYIKIYYLLGE